MGVAQVAVIHRLLDSLTAAFAGKPNRDWCAEIWVAGTDKDGLWVQVTDEAINFAYLFKTDPVDKLVELNVVPLPGMVCSEWQPGLFATLELVEAGDAEWLSHFIDLLFIRLYKCDRDYVIESDLVEV